MADINITSDLINNIASQENKKYIRNVNNLINQILGASVQDLSKKISFVTAKNVILQPVNELISGGFVDTSNFVYFLGIQNSQLELNTVKKLPFWQNFKEKIKIAWQNRKVIYKRKKKHRKKEKPSDKVQKKEEIDLSKYTLYNLADDLQNTIINYLTETSMVYLNGNILQIIGKDDFGSNTKIYIYIVSYDGSNYKYYAGRKKGFIEININSRLNRLSEKIDKVGENFIKILKIFNTLYCNTNGFACNQIFLESILYSIPDELYLGKDIYKVFIKIVNHLIIKSFKDIRSINNYDQTIFKDEVCGNSMLGFNKMMNRIKTN